MKKEWVSDLDILCRSVFPSLSLRSLLLIVTVSVAVAMAGGFGYFHWQRTQTPQSLFESGKKYYEQKKYQEATIQLMNAVRKDPHHKEAGLLLSHILAASGNLNAAAVQLKSLLEHYPDDPPRIWNSATSTLLWTAAIQATFDKPRDSLERF